MRLLVLGGSGFVGRAVADHAVGRGWDVTVFNRGHRPPPSRAARSTNTAAFDGPVLLARAGLILGPYEVVGRLPWRHTWAWLQSVGGAAPERDDRPKPGLDPAVEAKLLGQ